MKILSFAYQYPNSVNPGSGINIKNLMTAVDRNADIERNIIAPVPHCPRLRKFTDRYQAYEELEESYVAESLEIHHPKYINYPYEFLKNPITAMIEAIEAHPVSENMDNFDIYEAQSLYPDALLAHYFATKHNKPLILTARGDDVNYWLGVKKLQNKIIAAIDYAEKVICISPSLMEELINFGIPKEKLALIPNGLDQECFNLDVEANPLREKYYLSVGELTIDKGHHVILDAFDSLLKERLIIVGSGEQRRDLKRRAKDLGIAGRVQFIKYLNQPKLAEFYRGATATIHMSSMESMPSVISEALSCGSPVISTNIGDIGNIITDKNGFLLDEQDDYLLVRAIEKLRNIKYDENVVSNSVKGKSWDNVANEHMTLFKEFLS